MTPDEERELVERMLESVEGMSSGRASEHIRSAVGPYHKAPSSGTIKRWRAGDIGTPLRGMSETVQAYARYLEGGPRPPSQDSGIPDPDYLHALARTLDPAFAVTMLQALHGHGRREGWPDGLLGKIASELAGAHERLAGDGR